MSQAFEVILFAVMGPGQTVHPVLGCRRTAVTDDNDNDEKLFRAELVAVALVDSRKHSFVTVRGSCSNVRYSSHSGVLSF